MLIYRLTVQTLPDGLETQFTPPDTTQTALSCHAWRAVWIARLRLNSTTRAPTGPDQTRVSDKVRGLCLVGSGRARVVEFSYHSAAVLTCWRRCSTTTTQLRRCRDTHTELQQWRRALSSVPLQTPVSRGVLQRHLTDILLVLFSLQQQPMAWINFQLSNDSTDRNKCLADTAAQ